MNKNGTIWLDTDGETIQAHGGMVLCHQDTYYWYGENKSGPTYQAPSGDIRADFMGISCYSSKDCVRWKNEGVVLPPSVDEGSDLHKSKVCERPKVLYHEKNKTFVMWMHVDTADYTAALAGVALAHSPTGPFTYLGSVRPNRSDCRDMTVFQDLDGRAYLVHSSDWNKTLRISQMDKDYIGLTGVCTKAFTDQEREAPALFFHQGLYYMVTSGCTGWAPNSALYGVSKNVLSGWKLIDNPCTGPFKAATYHGQSTYVFKKDGVFYLMLDHWNPKNLKLSGYSFLPIHVEGLNMDIPFVDSM